MVGGHQQHRIRGQRLDEPGQQRVHARRRLVPRGRADTEHVGSGVQVGGIAVDQSRRRAQFVGHPLGVVVGRGGRTELRATIRGVGQPAADEPLRQHGAHAGPGLREPLNQVGSGCHAACGGIVAPPDVVEHPVGAGDVERKAQNAVLAGLRAGAQRHQAGRRRRREGALELQQSSGVSGQHGGEQGRTAGQLRQQMPAHPVHQHDGDAVYPVDVHPVRQPQPVDGARGSPSSAAAAGSTSQIEPGTRSVWHDEVRRAPAVHW